MAQQTIGQANASATLDELERLLAALLAEQKRLLDLLLRQRQAMRSLDAPSIESISREQDSARSRVASIESRRRAVALQAARELKLPLPPNVEPTLRALASAVQDPSRQARLSALREELRGVTLAVTAASAVSGRVAGSVLGHINSALRLLASAMRDAGTYNRLGAPRCGGRIGALELVG